MNTNKHKEAYTGFRMTDAVGKQIENSNSYLKNSNSYFVPYYSGQGEVLLKSLDGEYSFLGNVPELTINFIDRSIFMRFEGFGETAVPLVFNISPQVKKIKLYNKKVVKGFGGIIKYIPQKHYSILFDGINTANNNERIYFELYNVHFGTCEGITLISDKIEEFKINGKFEENHNHEVGQIYTYNAPKKKNKKQTVKRKKSHKTTRART